MAPGSDHKVLLAGGAQAIGHRRGVAAGRELGFPQLLAGFDVEATQETVGGTGDEYNSGSGDNRPAHADRAKRDLLRMRAAEILHGAEGNLPKSLSPHEVDCGEHAPRWWAAREIGGGLNKAAIETVGGSNLIAVVTVLGVGAAIVVFLAGNEADNSDKVVGVSHQGVARRIEGVTTPGHAPEIARHHQGSLQGGRSKDAFVPQMLDVIAAPITIFWSRSPSLICGKSMWDKWRRLHGKRLRWRGDFTGNIALGNGALFNGENGLTGVAVENEEQSRLVAL